MPVRYPEGAASAGTLTVNRTVPSLPGSITCSGGATRTQLVAEYGPFSLAPSNCGAPSRDRSQSLTRARTLTASGLLLLSVTACVELLPGLDCSSTRRGETSTEICAVAGRAPISSAATARNG